MPNCSELQSSSIKSFSIFRKIENKIILNLNSCIRSSKNFYTSLPKKIRKLNLKLIINFIAGFVPAIIRISNLPFRSEITIQESIYFQVIWRNYTVSHRLMTGVYNQVAFPMWNSFCVSPCTLILSSIDF